MVQSSRAKAESSPHPETALHDLRLKLLQLHQFLLEMERAQFEKMFGRVDSGELLQLVISHAQFAWLRMVSALVVQIDEMLDGDEPTTAAGAHSLFTQARQLFTSSDNEEFREKYQAALQNEPDIVMAHSEVMKLLRQKK
jgi:hypothetical protein